MGGIEPTTVPTQDNLGKFVSKGADEKTALTAFEAYFVGEMMKRTAPENPTGLFDGGQAGRMYQDHLYEEMARLIAEQGGFGFAKQLEGHLGTPVTPASPSNEPPASAAPIETQRGDRK